MTVHTSNPSTRDQLDYAHLLVKEAPCHRALGWLDYDWAFLQQAALDTTMQWNTLVPGLTSVGTGLADLAATEPIFHPKKKQLWFNEEGFELRLFKHAQSLK